MEFIVDCMLGKSAKWLKILGFDVLFFNKIEDKDLLDIAKKESRILLSRDTELIERAYPVQSLFIESDDWREQVEQVLEELSLWEQVKPLSRCIECNDKLNDLPKKRAKNLVAPFVYEQVNSFSICPGCGRVFWKGTHHKDMELKIKEILRGKRKLDLIFP